MGKILATLLMTFALISWSAAQTAQTQSTDSNKSSSANGIEQGPTVDTTDRSATINWKTKDPAGSIVWFGTEKNNLKREARAGGAGGSLDHSVTLSNLQPGTKYFYRLLKGTGESRAEGEFTTKGAGESASSGGSQSGGSSGSQAGSKEDRVVITEGPTVQPGADGTAKIVWKTDDIAATDVKYGTDQNNLQQRAFKPGGSRDHEADLKNLQAGQTYYFQVLRRDGTARTTGQFQYQPQAAATTPVVGQQPSGQTSPVQITQGPWLDTVADSRAIITWRTNLPSSTAVRYGTDRNSLNQVAQGNWGTDHGVTIEGLKPNAIYFFQVESSQASGQVGTKGEIGGFQTVAPGAQAKKNPPVVH